MLTTLINQNLGSLTTCSVRAEAITPEKGRGRDQEKDGKEEMSGSEPKDSFHVLPTVVLLRQMDFTY